MKKILSLIVVMVVAATAAISQAPGIFNYQGVARNSVGNVLVNQAISLRLTIHDVTAGGPTVYQETRAVVTNPFGLFNVQVGSPGATNITGTVPGVAWAVGAKFIQVEIDPNGGSTFINIGTAQVASVPYSLFATTSGDLVLPFTKSQANAGTLFSITNTGTGASGFFAVNNAASSATALTGTTNGTGNGVLGQHTATTGTAAGVRGESNSTDANAMAVQGVITSTTPGGFSAGVRGTNNGTGGLGIGVYGSQGGSGWGVYGTTPSGIGVHGNSTSGFGMYGLSTTGIGVYGLSTNAQAAMFEISNNANSSNALTANTNGTGWAAQFTSTNGTPRALRTVGGIQLTGINEAANRILTSDATGNATWQVPAPATDLVLPFDKTQAENGFLFRLTNSGVTSTSSAIEGRTNSTAASAYGIRGEVTSTTPGGFSTGVRGLNNGTGGLGIGVWGSQGGSGWGVYGVTPNGLGVYGNSTAAGFGIYGNSSSGTGVYGTSQTGQASHFEITNPASNSSVTSVTNNGIGSGITVQLPNAANGARGIDVLQAGVGPGVFSTSAGGNAVWGITSSISAAGVIGDNTYGEAVVGRNRGGIGVGAVVGRNDSSGYGVRGFNTKDGIGVLGQTGISGGQGNAARFENVNAANNQNTVEVATNGIGEGINVQLTNAGSGARGIDVLVAGVGTAGFATSAGGTGWWGITASISAAGILGDNTFGEAVVGRNRGGLGVGAVVGRNDSSGYGVRGFNTKDGIGVLGQAGISGGTGNGGRFENVNAANPTDVVIITGNGTGASLIVNNSNGGAANLSIFRKANVNVARIDDTGKGFFNGGTQVGGADVAEYFDVEGLRSLYEPGDVLVISQNSDRRVERSSIPYSTLVSGVYATKPGVALTERNAEADQLNDMVPMGVLGVIPTKVCMEGGAIKRGDLLVTSSIPGVAMKADPDKVKVGQVLGKALQDYNATEVGKINVLVSVK